MKERLDVILVEQGYAPSREKAKAIIMSGNVYVNGQKEDKAGTGFDVSKIKLEVRNHTMKYVSRGGLKLEKAMEQWGFLLDGMICMDIGASTGGFTDCMLQNGATKVYSVDVGLRQRGCVLYFSDQDFDPGEKSVKDRRTDGVSDQAPVRGWQRQGGQERCGERASDPRGSDPQDHRLCGQRWFRSTASGIFPHQGTGGQYRISPLSPESC